MHRPEKMLLRALLVAITLALLPECEPNAGTTQHPSVNKYILEGSSEMIMPNISSYPRIIALRKKNHSSPDWNDILSIRKGKLTHFRTEYKAHFSILENGLGVVNFSKILIGEYQLVGQLDQNLFLHIFLRRLDVTQCPPGNTLGSSLQMIQPNVSSYPNSIAVRKKNGASSDWNYILNIRNGELRNCLTEYMVYFSVLGNDFVVGNSSKILTGEYQLVDQHTGKCLQNFSIIPNSEPSHDDVAIGLAVFALVIVLALALTGILWWKCRRGRSAHPPTGAPDLGNELLPSTAEKTKGTPVSLLSEESGTVANGMA